MKKTPSDYAAINIVPRYAPRVNPTPIPATNWDDEKILCVRANEFWMSHIIGALEVLDQPDTWEGTDEEIQAARDNVNEILANIRECGDDKMCCCTKVIIYRFNPDTGRLEQSDDGGLTWENSSDPRYDNPTIPNTYVGTDDQNKCLGAANVEEIFREHAQELIDQASLWTSITALIPLILTLLIWIGVAVTFGALTPIALGLTAALMNVGREAFEAAMTGEVYNTFACIVYCHIQDDVTFTEDDIAAIQSDLYGQLTGIAPRFLADYVKILGVVGMTNAARSGRVATADCSDCQCGELDCGFTTTHLQNSSRWVMATELVNTVVFEKPIGLVVHTDGAPVFSALGNQTLAASTTFEEPCYITTVSMTTLGRSNPGNITVAYKLVLGGEWIDAGTQSYSSWSAATVKTFEVNAPVVAIQIQSEAFNSGQNTINSVVIGDPTP